MKEITERITKEIKDAQNKINVLVQKIEDTRNESEEKIKEFEPRINEMIALYRFRRRSYTRVYN